VSCFDDLEKWIEKLGGAIEKTTEKKELRAGGI